MGYFAARAAIGSNCVDAIEKKLGLKNKHLRQKSQLLQPGSLFVALNAQFAEDPRWKPITQRKPPPPDHAHWSQVWPRREALPPPPD